MFGLQKHNFVQKSQDLRLLFFFLLFFVFFFVSFFFSFSFSFSFSFFFCHLGVTCRTCKPSSIHCCIGRANSHQINLKCTGTRLQRQGHTGEIPMHMPEAGHIEAQMIRTYCSEMSISSTRKRLGSQRIKILLKYFWTRAICTVVKEVLSGTMPQMYKQGGNCKY